MDGTVPSSRRTSAEVCAESALPPAQSPPPIDHLEIMETHISEARSISSKNGSKSSRQGSCHEQEANLPMGFRLFFPELAHVFRGYFLIVVRAVALTTVLMWISLPVFWAALSTSAQRTTSLKAWFIDRDGSRIGNSIWETFNSSDTPAPRLGWVPVDPVDAGSDENVMNMILAERAWVAVVVEANATQNLINARESGDVQYDPNSVIKVYYAQARNEVAAGNYIVPITTNLLQLATITYATSSAQKYFAQINPQGNPNKTALELIAKAPQTIAPAVGWTMFNLRPYTAPAAQAVTLVGNIFLCIFAFLITMAHATARALVQPHLRFASYLTIRLVVPLIAYLPLSMSYCLVSLAFKLPFNAKYSEGSGFMLFFFYVYLGMASLGLAQEAMITLTTPRFVPFFLFILIIYNVSPVILPQELQPSFFQYGVGFPIWNLSQAVRTIMFNTRTYFGRNAAVMIAWILLSCVTIAVFSWCMHRYDQSHTNTPYRPPSLKIPSDKEVDQIIEEEKR